MQGDIFFFPIEIFEGHILNGKAASGVEHQAEKMQKKSASSISNPLADDFSPDGSIHEVCCGGKAAARDKFMFCNYKEYQLPVLNLPK